MNAAGLNLKALTVANIGFLIKKLPLFSNIREKRTKKIISKSNSLNQFLIKYP